MSDSSLSVECPCGSVMTHEEFAEPEMDQSRAHIPSVKWSAPGK